MAAPELKKLSVSVDASAADRRWAESLLPPIPASVATLEDAWKGGERTVLLIQDAHTNNSAQLNTARLLDVLYSGSKDLSPSIHLEAGRGDESLTFLKDGVPAAKRENVARSFLLQARLQGSEYLNLTTDHAVRLFGVEDMALYAESIELYRRGAAARGRFSDYLERVESAVEILKPRLLNPFLLALENKRRRHLRQEMSTVDYCLALLREGRRLGLSVPTPHLALLEELKALEARVDFQKAEEEKSAVMAALSPEERAEIGGTLKAAPAGDRRIQRAFFLSLFEKAQDPARYPNLSAYAEYLRRSDGLDSRGILKEQASLEREVFERLTIGPDERSLLDCARGVRLLKKLLHLQCTPEEYDEYRAGRLVLDIRQITGFLNKKIMDAQSDHDRASYLEDGYDETVALCEKFYELTRRRDEAFLDNMEKADDGAPLRILIAGGYHTPNLKALLKRRNVSYVCLTPQVLQETNVARYEEILLAQRVPPAFAVAGPSANMTMRTIFSGGTETLARALDLTEDRVRDAVRKAGARLSADAPTAAAPESGPRFRPLGPGEILVAFGSSSVAGVVDPNQSFPAILGRMLDRPVINEGIPGERATSIHGPNGAQRLPGTLDRHHPALLILWHGRNDILFDAEKGPAVVKGVLREMIREAQARGIQVLLLGSPVRHDDVRDAPLYRELSEEMNVPYLPDIYEGIIGNSGRMADDIHANADGNYLFAQRIENFLRDKGAIGPFQVYTFYPPVHLHTQHLSPDRAVYFTVGAGESVTAAQCMARIRSKLRDDLRTAGRVSESDAVMVDDFGHGYFRFKAVVPPGTGEYTLMISSDGKAAGDPGKVWVPWDSYVRVGITPERQVVVVPTGLSIDGGTDAEIRVMLDAHRDIVEPIYRRAVDASGGMFTMEELQRPYDQLHGDGQSDLERYRRILVRMVAHTVFAVSQYEVLRTRFGSRMRPDVVTGDSLGLEAAMIIAGSLTLEDFIGFFRERLALGPDIIPAKYALVRVQTKGPDDIKTILEPGRIEAFSYRTGDTNFLIVGGSDRAQIQETVYGIAQRLKIDLHHTRITYPIGPQIHHTLNGEKFNERMEDVIRAIPFRDPTIPILDSSEERTGIIRTAEQVRQAFRMTLFGPAYWSQAHTLLERSQQIWLSSSGGQWTGVERWLGGARLAGQRRSPDKVARVRRVLQLYWDMDGYATFKNLVTRMMTMRSAGGEKGIPGVGELLARLAQTKQRGQVREILAEPMMAWWFLRHVPGSKLIGMNLHLGGRELDALFWVEGHTFLPDGLYVVEIKEDQAQNLDTLIEYTLKGQGTEQFDLFAAIRKKGVRVHEVVVGAGPNVTQGPLNKFVVFEKKGDDYLYSFRFKLNVSDNSMNSPGFPHEDTLQALGSEKTDTLAILAEAIPALRKEGVLEELRRHYEPTQAERAVRREARKRDEVARGVRAPKPELTAADLAVREASGWLKNSSFTLFIGAGKDDQARAKEVLERFFMRMMTPDNSLRAGRSYLQNLVTQLGPERAWRFLREDLTGQNAAGQDAPTGDAEGARLAVPAGDPASSSDVAVSTAGLTPDGRERVEAFLRDPTYANYSILEKSEKRTLRRSASAVSRAYPSYGVRAKGEDAVAAGRDVYRQIDRIVRASGNSEAALVTIGNSATLVVRTIRELGEAGFLPEGGVRLDYVSVPLSGAMNPANGPEYAALLEYLKSRLDPADIVARPGPTFLVDAVISGDSMGRVLGALEKIAEEGGIAPARLREKLRIYAVQDESELPDTAEHRYSFLNETPYASDIHFLNHRFHRSIFMPETVLQDRLVRYFPPSEWARWRELSNELDRSSVNGAITLFETYEAFKRERPVLFAAKLAAGSSSPAAAAALDGFLARTARPGKSMALSLKPGEPSILVFRGSVDPGQTDVYLGGKYLKTVAVDDSIPASSVEAGVAVSSLVFALQEVGRRFDRPMPVAAVRAPYEYYLHADDYAALPEDDRKNALAIEIRALAARKAQYQRIHVVSRDASLRPLILGLIESEDEKFTADEGAPAAGVASVHSIHKSYFKSEADRQDFLKAYPGARILARDDMRDGSGRYNLFAPIPGLVLAEKVSLISDIRDPDDARFREAYAYFKELVLSGCVDDAERKAKAAELTPALFSDFLEGRLSAIRQFPLPPALRAIDLGRVLRVLAMGARMAAQAA